MWERISFSERNSVRLCQRVKVNCYSKWNCYLICSCISSANRTTTFIYFVGHVQSPQTVSYTQNTSLLGYIKSWCLAFYQLMWNYSQHKMKHIKESRVKDFELKIVTPASAANAKPSIASINLSLATA